MGMGPVGRSILYCIHKLSMTVKRTVRYWGRKGIENKGHKRLLEPMHEDCSILQSLVGRRLNNPE